MVSLLAVTCGVFFLAYAAAKYLPGRMARMTGRSGRLKVVERIMVGKDRQIAVVRAGSQVFLVGIAGQSVQIGPSLDPAEFEAEPAARDGNAALAPPVSFSDMLRKAGFPLPGKGKDPDQ
ncbi:MAG: flagellar biosynthetic protein FliO [Clostridia bacterium]|nr:flagellar biosynthetic protein FliO [Clostridia bacterium]